MNWRSTIAVIAVTLVTGGVATAVADIPDSGVINGCYSNQGGALRVIDTSAGQSCDGAAGETPIEWNHTGPPGARGARGENGQPGPGTDVSVYQASVSSPHGFVPRASRIAQLDLRLPAGAFAITAKATLGLAGGHGAGCTLATAATPLDSAWASGIYDGYQTETTIGAATLASPGTVSLYCGGEDDVGSMHIVAVEVNAIRSTTFPRPTIATLRTLPRALQYALRPPPPPPPRRTHKK